jgi:TM2 domain-containing membrane protein YozV
MYKIVGADGHQYGPVTADQLRQWLAENRVNAQTIVQAEGATEWKPLNSLPEFAANLKPPLVAIGSTPPSAIASRAGNKIPAGILGILLGSLGIHKFILGYTGAGLIMLLVTVLTCGVAWPVMHIIGLIEGIVYLCKSDEEFVRTYVEGRREWF